MYEGTVPGREHRTLSRGLTGTLRAFFYAAAAIAAASVFAVNHEVGRFELWWGTRSPAALDRLVQAEEASAAMIGLFLLSALVIAVLVIIWWYQAYQAIERVGATDRSWSAGWAIGGWFIPLASLIIPKLVLNEIDRVSAAAEEGGGEWRDRRTLGVATWWWGLWVMGSLALGFGATLTQSQLDPNVGFDGDLYLSGLRFTMVGLAALFGAALFAAASLRIIGSRLAR